MQEFVVQIIYHTLLRAESGCRGKGFILSFPGGRATDFQLINTADYTVMILIMQDTSIQQWSQLTFIESYNVDTGQ
jgi:hypothetical protein